MSKIVEVDPMNEIKSSNPIFVSLRDEITLDFEAADLKGFGFDLEDEDYVCLEVYYLSERFLVVRENCYDDANKESYLFYRTFDITSEVAKQIWTRLMVNRKRYIQELVEIEQVEYLEAFLFQQGIVIDNTSWRELLEKLCLYHPWVMISICRE